MAGRPGAAESFRKTGGGKFLKKPLPAGGMILKNHRYAERSPTAAAAFTDLLDVAAEAVRQAPEAWPPYDHGTRRFLLRRFPYFLVYRVEPTRVVIVAVAHAHRRPGYWKDRPGIQG
jgi:plasmid stabilization system protein ParE